MAASARSIFNSLQQRLSGMALPQYDRLHGGESDHEKHNSQSIWASRAFRRFGIIGLLVAFCIVIIASLHGDYKSLSRLFPDSYQPPIAQSSPSIAIINEYPNATKHLVVASYSKQNVTWLSQIPSAYVFVPSPTDYLMYTNSPPRWQVQRYWMDDPKPPKGILAVPRNQGREAMAYLTYIIDNYESLPDFMIFTHGHERSWHQVEQLQHKVRALNLTALEEENYISLRCGDQMGCEKQPYIDTDFPNWEGEAHMCDFWNTIMPSEPCPRYISYKCCAQHAVTRKAVQTRTLEQWTQIREPLLHDFSDYKSWGEGASDWLGGMFYEKFWHVLLGAGDEYCPSVEHCRQVHFSNAIICDQDIDLTLFEGEAWKDTVCVSAFDDLEPDAPVESAIRAFHRVVLGKLAEIRGRAGKLREKQQKLWHEKEAAEKKKGSLSAGTKEDDAKKPALDAAEKQKGSPSDALKEDDAKKTMLDAAEKTKGSLSDGFKEDDVKKMTLEAERIKAEAGSTDAFEAYAPSDKSANDKRLPS